MTLKVSISPGNRKTGRIPALSLPAGITCTADARKTCFKGGCYAAKLSRIYPSARSAWQDNLTILRADPDGFFGIIRAYLSRTKPKFFRIHVSGDFNADGGNINARDYFIRWAELAREFPGTRFLAFTKCYEMIRENKRFIPGNLRIVFSAWPGEFVPYRCGFPVAFLSEDSRAPKSARTCPGNCETCGLCWALRPSESVHFDRH